MTQAQTRLGRYELLARLATGGMGEIFLARLDGAAGFEKLVVVKRVLPHLADDARFRQMLISEARIASKLNHANICQVFELGDADGQLYIAMEYLEGVTLLPLLRQSSRDNTPLDLGCIGAVVQQVADALHFAHEMRDRSGEPLGIVHRDVTPSNVFLTESGVVKVLDFGIAKAKGASATATQTGAVKGKYAYMAPEQLRGAADIDRRVDTFAMGIVLYEMLALRRLFQRRTDYLTFQAVMEEPIPEIRRYRPDAPDALVAVVTKALDRDPAKRFETIRALATAVLDAIGKRAWSQGELGDFVRTNFASDIGKRSYQVASAVSRTEPGNPRTTMPLLTNPDTVTDDPDEDTEFRPVETEVADRPPIMPPPPSPHAMTSSDFGGSTPQPFGIDSTSSGAQLQPLPPGYAPAKRSMAWPILAVGAVLIAGGVAAYALLVRPQQQTSVVISTNDKTHVGSDNHIVVGDPVDARAEPVPVVVDAAVVVDAPPAPPPPKKGPYDQVIASRLGQINECLQAHPETTMPASAKLHIATSGKPMRVSLSPSAADATPLGDCIKKVLLGATFPTTKDEADMTFPFTVKSG